MMRRTIVLVLQVITLLIFVMNHFLNEIIKWTPSVYFFGILIDNLIIDVTLFVPIILQIFIIIILSEEKK